MTAQAYKPPGQGQIPFPSERDLEVFAKKIASGIRAPLVIWLEGDLGAGKTTFARALIQALGYQGRVKSPTYGLLEHYTLASLQVLHLDLYRIGDPDEVWILEMIGKGPGVTGAVWVAPQIHSSLMVPAPSASICTVPIFS